MIITQTVGNRLLQNNKITKIQSTKEIPILLAETNFLIKYLYVLFSTI